MTLWIPRNGSKGRNKIMEQPTHGRIEEKICWSHVCLWGEPQGTRLSGQLLIPVTPPPSFPFGAGQADQSPKDDEAKGWECNPEQTCLSSSVLGKVNQLHPEGRCPGRDWTNRHKESLKRGTPGVGPRDQEQPLFP